MEKLIFDIKQMDKETLDWLDKQQMLILDFDNKMIIGKCFAKDSKKV